MQPVEAVATTSLSLLCGDHNLLLTFFALLAHILPGTCFDTISFIVFLGFFLRKNTSSLHSFSLPIL